MSASSQLTMYEAIRVNCLQRWSFFSPTNTTLKGKADTGAIAKCMPVLMLQDIGLNRANLMATDMMIRGVTGTDMKACGRQEIEVRCNNQSKKKKKKAKIIVTKLANELILGMELCRLFSLVIFAETCIQRQVNVCQQKTAHITDESDVHHDHLRQKWKHYLPLESIQVTLSLPPGDIKAIFPETFDGKIRLFNSKAKLKVLLDAKLVQGPPHTVAFSMLLELKSELDQMECNGIICPCSEMTDWVRIKEEWRYQVVFRPKKSKQIPHQECAPHRLMGRHLREFCQRRVLLYS